MTVLLSRRPISFALTKPRYSIDQRRDQLAGEVMAPTRIGLDLRTRYQARNVAAAFDGQQWVFLTVQHQGRRRDRLQELDPVTRGDDRQVLPRAAFGIPAS